MARCVTEGVDGLALEAESDAGVDAVTGRPSCASNLSTRRCDWADRLPGDRSRWMMAAAVRASDGSIGQ